MDANTEETQENPNNEIASADIQVDSGNVGIIPDPQQAQLDDYSTQNEKESRDIVQNNLPHETLGEKTNPPEEQTANENDLVPPFSAPEKQTEVMIKIIGTRQQFEAVLRYIDQIGADYQVYVLG